MNDEHTFGVDGDTGKMVDMKELNIFEPALVKIQTLKTAIEVFIFIYLRLLVFYLELMILFLQFLKRKINFD